MRARPFFIFIKAVFLFESTPFSFFFFFYLTVYSASKVNSAAWPRQMITSFVSVYMCSHHCLRFTHHQPVYYYIIRYNWRPTRPSFHRTVVQNCHNRLKPASLDRLMQSFILHTQENDAVLLLLLLLFSLSPFEHAVFFPPVFCRLRPGRRDKLINDRRVKRVRQRIVLWTVRKYGVKNADNIAEK